MIQKNKTEIQRTVENINDQIQQIKSFSYDNEYKGQAITTPICNAKSGCNRS